MSNAEVFSLLGIACKACDSARGILKTMISFCYLLEFSTVHVVGNVEMKIYDIETIVQFILMFSVRVLSQIKQELEGVFGSPGSAELQPNPIPRAGASCLGLVLIQNGPDSNTDSESSRSL